MDKEKKDEKKIKRRPIGTVTRINEPNYDLMAKAVIDLHKKHKGKIEMDEKEKDSSKGKEEST